MKRLLLMRHAKSDWNEGSTNDFERPLNYRGRKDATKMARFLVQEQLVPEIVLVSPARRTTETWERINAVFQENSLSITGHSIEAFYLGGLGQIQPAFSNTFNHLHTALILGHNPGWSNASSLFSQQKISLTTADVVILKHLSDSWEEAIHSDEWQLHGHFSPKDVRL